MPIPAMAYSVSGSPDMRISERYLSAVSMSPASMAMKTFSTSSSSIYSHRGLYFMRERGHLR